MVETIPPIEKLRNCITGAHLFAQAVRLNLITTYDRDKFIKELNDKTHVVISDFINSFSVE